MSEQNQPVQPQRHPGVYDPTVPRHEIIIAGGTTFVITNHLFGRPLYSWWIFEIEDYAPEEIEGTLMDDIRGGISGPYANRGQAHDLVRQWQTEILSHLDKP